MASLKRRLAVARTQLGCDTLSNLQAKVLHEPEMFAKLCAIDLRRGRARIGAAPLAAASLAGVVPVTLGDFLSITFRVKVSSEFSAPVSATAIR